MRRWVKLPYRPRYRSPPEDWNRPSSTGGSFDSLLDDVLGSGVKRILETVVQRATFPCIFCGNRTVFRCCSCGSCVCNIHAFINVQAWNQIMVICSNCVSQYFPFVNVSQNSQPPPSYDDYQNWPYVQPPWEVLGVLPNASESEINAAFKNKAKTAHPDVGGTDEEMSFIASARMWMLKHRRKTI